ncbi:hypothetical protein [Mycobacteroides abscessus]|uniref:hypothetical protein n=1 Tax=Mycobacteroides abscessus TaxID=36809 RepID=UPI0009C7B0C5|nr:hypothetical protein [Mycobacteroides abscessus]MBL3751523.1 hypothetical protein [Mycobacteroides abscessus subsp. massiliense]SKE68996.1 Uncharacterised protein [Mycobacteroides abscessus subsp. massiliense]SKH82492.1 Uncharacterised protein [Mycobacteroides abscessus subsp. massiliense]SKI34755.1 Uncharacterised protein [Mycobacteroides abscessus subsp. massiliense]SKJ35255.1 Uncharacterised protein [Mycobacteroides abscessus subsp. massiliense]
MTNSEQPQNFLIEDSGINDQDLRNVARNLAIFINEVAQMPPFEPNVDIEELNRKYSSELYPKPLTYTHQVMRYLLESVRDSLLAISNMFHADPMTFIPAAALVRQIAEYSAAVYYISDASDSAQMRIAKAIDMTKTSLLENEGGQHHHPDVRKFYSEGKDRTAGWKGTTDLPKVKERFGGNAASVKRLFENLPDEKLGKGYYNRLSGLTHPSVVDLVHAKEMMWRENRPMQSMYYGDAVFNIILGLRCAYTALARSIQFHVPRTELEYGLLNAKINQFRWFIEELVIRQLSFQKTYSEIVSEAYKIAGLKEPDGLSFEKQSGNSPEDH